MTRRTQKNFYRQMSVVQNLEVPPRPEATVTKFETEEWSSGHVFVKLEYCPGPHAPTLRYTEGYVIGVMGGREVLYRHHNV